MKFLTLIAVLVIYPGTASSAAARAVSIGQRVEINALDFSPAPAVQATSRFSDESRKIRISGTTRVNGRVILGPAGCCSIRFVETGSGNLTMTTSSLGRFGTQLAVGREYVISLTWNDGTPLDVGIVKSISLGSTNLMTEKLRISGPVSGQIMVTLGPAVPVP